MEAIGIGGDDHAETRLTVLRAIDKLDKFGPEGVRLLLGAGRKDESGDFTKGAGLDADAIERVIKFVEAGGQNNEGTIANLQSVVTGDFDLEPEVSGSGAQGVEELRQIASLVKAAGYNDGRVKIDPSVVRGLEYYTGPVYEAELLFDVTNEKGQTVQFGSVGGGGRYDGLVSRFMGQPVPATGFSIGVSRLMTALKNLGKLGDEEAPAPVVVCVMDRDIDSMGHYQRFVSRLRDAGIRAEMFQGNPKNFGKQLQYADRRGSPVAIIQGSQERSEGTVQIKDLIEGKRLSGEIEDNAAWRAARPAQVQVPEDELVAEVQKILDAQAQDREQGQ